MARLSTESCGSSPGGTRRVFAGSVVSGKTTFCLLLNKPRTSGDWKSANGGSHQPLREAEDDGCYNGGSRKRTTVQETDRGGHCCYTAAIANDAAGADDAGTPILFEQEEEEKKTFKDGGSSTSVTEPASSSL